MCTTNCVGQARTTDCCWNAFQQSRIFNQHGCCSHSAQAPAGVCCEPHRVSPNLFAADPGCRDSCGVVGSGCPPVVAGWIGPPSGPRVSPAAYWSSWADCLATTAKRQPAVAEQLVTALTNGASGSYLDAVGDSRHTVSALQVGEISSATTLRAQGRTTWTTENQDPGLGGRLSLRCLWRNGS